MTTPLPLILASASPRRRELLGRFGIDFDIEAADIDETVADDEAPAEYVARMAKAKAGKVAAGYPGRFVLGSDTAVVVDGKCLGKPADDTHAVAMLERLSGRSHEVLSAVALVDPDAGCGLEVSTTRVVLADLPADWIRAYVASGAPHDKAGAYGIQDRAGIWVRRIEGSYTGVVGLPLFETGVLLRRAGLV